MKVSAILKGIKDKQGKQKVYIRISDKLHRSFKATKLKVTKSDWDKKKGAVKSSHPDAVTYNSIIRKLIQETEAEYVKGEYQVKRKRIDVDFFSYVESLWPVWEKTREKNTLRTYKRDANHLKRFRKAFTMKQVDVNFLQAYQEFLAKSGMSQNSVWGAFKFLKMVMNKAHRAGVIEQNPFDRFDNVQMETRMRPFLTEDELNVINEKILKGELTERQAFTANWFLIGCYTGLRYGDKRAFDRHTHIIDGRLIVETEKTGAIISLPVTTRIKDLFERVKYQPLKISNQKYNQNLKTIMKKCGINKVVTAHISRHTFATLCASKKVPIEIAAKMLGHRDTKTTSIYYKIMNVRIDEEFAKLG